jgi:hypothetical protein
MLFPAIIGLLITDHCPCQNYLESLDKAQKMYLCESIREMQGLLGVEGPDCGKKKDAFQ